MNKSAIETELTVTANPYKAEVTFTSSRETFERISGEDSSRWAGACTNVLNGSLVVGVFDSRKATLIHECVHASIFILQRAGINPIHDGGEAHAYLTEWLWLEACELFELD